MTAAEGASVLFNVRVSNQDTIRYQWQRQSNNIPGTTGATYVISSIALSNHNDRYRCVLSNSLGLTFSVNAVLTVVPDTIAPTLIGAQNSGTTNVHVTFSKAVEAATATNAANYVLNNGVTVSKVVFGADVRTVILTTSPLVLGNSYTVFVSNVRDRAGTPNTIAPNTPFTFVASEFASQDIGSAGPAGSIIVLTNGYDVSGGGLGIGGGAASDQFQFGSQPRTGDFDIRVRVQTLGLADVWSQAGLMAREDLSASGRFAAALATPSLSGCFFESRDPAGASSVRSGAFPVNYPFSWLRLKRAGNLFSGFASFDGQTWTQLGTATIAMPATVYFGLAVSSHTSTQASLAQFRDFGNATGAVTGTLPVKVEPLGPSSRNTGLVISEIMYKPAPRADTNNLEFIELFNANPFFEDLSGYRISGDVDFTFPAGTVLPGGGFLVIAKQPAELQSIYGLSGVTVLGPYTNTLKAPGLVRLRSKEDAILLEVNYDQRPPWPVAADGAGHSLVLARPSYGEGYAEAWDISDSVGGSPGGYDGVSFSPQRNVVINEFLAHTDPPLSDYVELYNHSNTPVDLSGCVLTDDADTNKFVLPANTTIPARGFLVFYQTNLNFALSASGERIYLKSADQRRVLDAVQFEPQANSVSMGRWPDGATQFFPMQTRTPGAANGSIYISDVVINELMYEPMSGLADDQYVELYNRGTSSVNIGGWRFTDGIDYRFPSNSVLASGAYLVVAKNPARLLANYGNLTAANTFGPFDGTLAASGERVALAKPDDIVTTNALGQPQTNIIFVVEDEVTFGTGGRWGRWANGGGSSLELIDPRSNHRLAANWADSNETAKAQWVTIEATGALDNGGGYPPDNLQVTLLDEGECLLDNVEVFTTGGNLVANPTFDSGLGNWFPQGNHVRSTLETGGGFGGSGNALHIRASARGDTGANRVRASLTSSLSGAPSATIRAKVRWLRGWPELVLRLRGNYLEATGRMAVPANLGTPGARNSRFASNVGPAIYEVTHTPVVPAANQNVVVTGRAHDANGLQSLVCQYRLDPSGTLTPVTMRDDGLSGDAVAGDGIYSATIPGQAAGTLVAFHIQATDNSGTPTRFPNDAPVRECLVRFGDPTPASGFGIYRIWMTQNNVNTWINRPSLSNERVEGTFVYGSARAIYNMTAKYAGSPYHQGFSSPVTAGCHYSIEMPLDDLFLGTENFNKIHAPGNGPFDDTTIQREQAAYWMVRQLGLPYNYRRYVGFYFNGNRKGTFMEDTQTPGRDLIREYYPNDHDGQLYKLQPWFEFDDVEVTGGNGAGFQNVSWCTLNNYTTTGGAKKLARYRYNYLTRAANGTANDYTNVYNLVETANLPSDPLYTAQMTGLIDMEQWMRTFAVEHAVGNWDSVGAQNAQNMYGYKPSDGKWRLHIWDYNIVLGNSGSWGPGANLFAVNGADGPMNRIFNHPPFRRMYWRGLKQLCNYAMVNANIDPLLDAKFAAFSADNVSVTSPGTIKQWISDARTSILSQLAGENGNAPFAINGPSSFTASTNLVFLSGTAAVEIKSLVINGVAWEPTWTSVSAWTLLVPVGLGTTRLSIVGYDLYGRPVAGASNQVTVVYSGPAPSPVGTVVINEIMYNPLVPGASYVELYNLASNFAFDLSGWELRGTDFVFPPGTFIGPTNFLLVVKDRDVCLNTYGITLPIAGEFGGHLQNGGETLRLIKPGATPALDLVVDELRYESDRPWPPEANGTGPSLQLRDPTRDRRIPANWAAGGTNASSSKPQWQYVTTTGSATSGKLYLYLNSVGDVYVDDLVMVAGTVPEAGANVLQNGDFETSLSGPWTVSPNLSDSAISTVAKHSGNASLHMVSSSGGSSQSTAIWELTAVVVTNATYTLSYWYLPSTNGSQLTVRLSGSGINSTIDIAPPPSTVATALFTPGAVNSTRTNLPPFPTLWINEIMPINTTNLADRFGHHEPWIELFNPGSSAISLNGFYFTDDYSSLLKWPFPAGASIGSGQFLTVFADAAPGETIANELHASFRLSASTGSVALVQLAAGSPQVLDYVNYNLVGPNRSLGSLPDGRPLDRRLFSIATPGATNNGTFLPVSVFINEWMAGNSGTIADPADGHYDDWFELYNAGPTTVDLSGYKLTDNLGNPGLFTIPSGKTVPPGGFLLVWADDDTGQNDNGPDLHTNFKLALSGEAIGLFDPNTNLVDAITFTAQTDNVSQGRAPDGFTNIVALVTATPGAPNFYGGSNTPPALDPIANQNVNEGTLLTFTASAHDNDQPAQALNYSLAPGAPSGVAIDSGSGVFTWSPSETQGPGFYNITIRVSDNGAPPLQVSRTFGVTVNEVNASPVLAAISNRTLSEGVPLLLTNTATDSDFPPNTLTFTLEPGAPANASINPSSGVLSWTPTEAQGPGVYPITVRVTDDAPTPLSDFRTFNLTVTEVNSAPSLSPIANRTINELTTLTLTNTASDSDLPAQTLTFALVSGPSGVNLDPATGVLTWTPQEGQPSSNPIVVRVFDNGSPSLSATQSFTVTVNEVNAAPTLTPIANRTINELSTLTLTNTASDPDLPPQTLTFALVSGPSGVNVDPATGVLTWTPQEAQGPNTNTVVVRVFDNGSPSLSATQSFTVTINEVNSAPTLTPIANRTVNELTTLTLTNTASDPDLPAQTLTFALVSGPSGVNLDPATGVLSWTPPEGQPSSNPIVVRVFDNGSPSLSATQSFTVTVSQVNSVPTLSPIANRTINELSTLTLTNTASDPDLPPQTLTFALVSGPSGVNVDPATGVLTWTPQEAQGPNTNTILVRVFDNGSPSLSATQSFTVTINEVNSAPTLTPIANRTVNELTTLTLTNTASDSDLPAQTLTFALVSGPSGVNLDPATGVLSWTPPEGQPSSNPIVVRLFDNGSPSLSATQSFTVTVNQVNSAPTLSPIANRTINELSTLTLTNIASDPDLPPQTLTFALVSGPSGVNVDPATGVLTWTPQEAQGPNTNTILVRVFDNGSPSLSATQSFTVTINEVNSAPTLTPIANRTVNELTTLTLTNSASDSDLPAQTLTFALVSGPSGVNLDPATGVLTWTPSEGQGPNTNTIVVRVFDNGTPSLSATQAVIVTVDEVNSAPVLDPIGNKTVTEGNLLTFNASASDADSPVQTLVYTLDAGAPAGATITPAGVFTWTPTPAQGPSNYTITIRVTDDGTPPLEDTETISINVVDPGIPLVLFNITNTWKYVDTGADLGTAWKETSFDDTTWLSGPALLYNETNNSIPGPKNTLLSLNAVGGGRIITYYFRTHFTFPADVAGVVLTASNLLDDGAIFYLNGTEAARINMPAGTTTSSTFSANVWEATNYYVTNVAAPSLVSGDNVLAVEVHQQGPNSTDVVFGLALSAAVPTQTPINIISQPAGSAITAGSSAQFSVLASGSYPLYQWLKNGAAIPGANGATYTIATAQLNDAGAYSVIVSNLVSAVTSASATLTVGPPPNSPPRLTTIGNLTANEGALLTFTATATDADASGQTLTFTLDEGAPVGAAITAAGVFTWTPNEAQGGGDHVVTVRVTDNGTPALDDFESVTIRVNEVNTAPVMVPIPPQSVLPGQLLTFTAVASDSDLPKQGLTFTLDSSAPPGASIDPTTGVFTWIPQATQADRAMQFGIRVTDNGQPPLGAAQTVSVLVGDAPIAPHSLGLTQDGSAQWTLSWEAQPGRVYQVQYSDSLASTSWVNLTGEITAEDTVESIRDDSSPATQRFYRVLLVR